VRSSETIEAAARRLQAIAPVDPGADEAAAKLAAAAARLTRDEALIDALVRSTGLSAPMVRWGLRTTLESVRAEVLLEVRRRAGLVFFGQLNRTRLCTVVLAGNVFTACIKAVLVPLLLEVPVLVRPSSRDGVLVRALAAALEEPFGAALSVVDFHRNDPQAWVAFFRHADVAHVFGSDETLRTLRSKVPAQTRFVGHGHGLGVAAVFPTPGTDLEPLAERLALDVAAYDQRGCLSPQRVYVVGDRSDASTLAEALHAALGAIEEPLPRGPIGHGERVACASWRATVAALGELYEGATHAVALIDGPAPAGPGYRHVTVRPLPTVAALRDALAPLGDHLKALGWGPDEAQASVSEALPPGVAPYVAALGEMQTPAFDVPWDGMPLTEGLLRFVG